MSSMREIRWTEEESLIGGRALGDFILHLWCMQYELNKDTLEIKVGRKFREPVIIPDVSFI